MRVLQREQVEAATVLHARLVQWERSDRALQALQVAMPGFDVEASIVKVAAINQLYGTNLYAVVRMAEHASRVLGEADVVEPATVDVLAVLPALEGEQARRHVSFASKFVHFFVDADRFPIYDGVAARVLRTRVDVRLKDPPAYVEWLAAAARLRASLPFECSPRDLDRYLWLRGLIAEWRNKGAQAEINAEVRRLLERGDDEGLVRTIEGVVLHPRGESP